MAAPIVYVVRDDKGDVFKTLDLNLALTTQTNYKNNGKTVWIDQEVTIDPPSNEHGRTEGNP